MSPSGFTGKSLNWPLNPDASPGRLPDILEGLTEEISVADDDRYPDGTLIRVNWPEIESDDEEDAGTMR